VVDEDEDVIVSGKSSFLQHNIMPFFLLVTIARFFLIMKKIHTIVVRSTTLLFILLLNNRLTVCPRFLRDRCKCDESRFS
jgi:hypothetical protein